MNNLQKYTNSFIEVFQVQADDVSTLKYQCIPAWDSVGHMSLMAHLEETFQIQLDTDDIIDFSSFDVGKEILRKHNVDLTAS
jgi:acyl carrier protein